MPKVRRSRSFERTEFAGRRAGVGYSLVGIAIRTGGVKPGERVVVEGLQKVRDGAPVKVVSVPVKAGG